MARNQYDAPACIEGFINYKLQGGSSGSADVVEARARLYTIQTEKTELETARARREVIGVDEHLADLRDLERIFNVALDGIDTGLADDLAILAEPAEINDRLTLTTNALRQAVADSIMKYSLTVEG